MTAIANTATTLTSKGIREDLEDTIYRVAPFKTPFQANIGTVPKATNAYHEWQTEGLETPSGSNAQLEGDDIASFQSEDLSARVGNYCQIFRKTGIVSETDNVVKKAGRASEVNRQKVLKGIALRTDMEMTFLANAGSAQQSGSNPRTSAGLPAWLVSNTAFGAGGSVGGFQAGSNIVNAATQGTARTFTEALLKSVRATAFANGATPNQVNVGPTDKQTMSGFTGIAGIRKEVQCEEQATIIGGRRRVRGRFRQDDLDPAPICGVGHGRAGRSQHGGRGHLARDRDRAAGENRRRGEVHGPGREDVGGAQRKGPCLHLCDQLRYSNDSGSVSICFRRLRTPDGVSSFSQDSIPPPVPRKMRSGSGNSSSIGPLSDGSSAKR
jgi:hypothetical protein